MHDRSKPGGRRKLCGGRFGRPRLYDQQGDHERQTSGARQHPLWPSVDAHGDGHGREPDGFCHVPGWRHDAGGCRADGRGGDIHHQGPGDGDPQFDGSLQRRCEQPSRHVKRRKGHGQCQAGSFAGPRRHRAGQCAGHGHAALRPDPDGQYRRPAESDARRQRQRPRELRHDDRHTAVAAKRGRAAFAAVVCRRSRGRARLRGGRTVKRERRRCRPLVRHRGRHRGECPSARPHLDGRIGQLRQGQARWRRGQHVHDPRRHRRDRRQATSTG